MFDSRARVFSFLQKSKAAYTDLEAAHTKLAKLYGSFEKLVNHLQRDDRAHFAAKDHLNQLALDPLYANFESMLQKIVRLGVERTGKRQVRSRKELGTAEYDRVGNRRARLQ